MRAVMSLVVWLTLLGPVWAVNPSEMLEDPRLEERARELSKILRCVKCRNQSIDDSNAAIARDMRVVLRERLAAGDSDDEALGFLVDRYGNYILLKPPVNPWTYALWAGPAVLLILTVAGFATLWRRSPDLESPPEMSDEDREILASVLDEGPGK